MSGVPEAGVVPIAYDEVIQDADIEQGACFDEALRELEILRARLRIAARVIVEEDRA